MKIEIQIKQYLDSLDEPKKNEMQQLHKHILGIMPKTKLWYIDGRDETGKVVTNPNIGYGTFTIQYANGNSKEFYPVGISATKTGISVYILGLKDINYLAQHYSQKIGKAKVTGYCINFKSIKDIDLSVLEEAIKYRVAIGD
ncbi:MAG: DUF1801 domain-containing protein [Bacteroidota bacterium]